MSAHYGWAVPFFHSFIHSSSCLQVWSQCFLKGYLDTMENKANKQISYHQSLRKTWSVIAFQTELWHLFRSVWLIWFLWWMLTTQGFLASWFLVSGEENSKMSRHPFKNNLNIYMDHSVFPLHRQSSVVPMLLLSSRHDREHILFSSSSSKKILIVYF